ncbi:MAG: GTP-binding protein [Myxococcales bacterium]|nr:GTP-binding protein [Myxococcales bacterium]
MVPILLLTGFLGSGKTTLLNRLLEERPNQGPMAESAGQLALIVNEFGDVGIDGDLLPDEMTRQIEIKGGCICCRLDGDLEKTLLELIEREPDLSAIIIETTGIAEPLPISWTMAQGRLADEVRLAAVITVADALEHEKHRPLSPSVDAQVEYADILVITKMDLAGAERCEAVKRVLRETNDVAPVLAGNTQELVSQLWQTLDDPSERSRSIEAAASSSSGGAESGGHHLHSLSLPIKETLDFELLSEELEGLSPDYIRIKGIARVVDASSGSEEPRMIVFHRVGARVSAEPARDDLDCRIVAIGSHIGDDELQACIDASVIGWAG